MFYKYLILICTTFTLFAQNTLSSNFLLVHQDAFDLFLNQNLYLKAKVDTVFGFGFSTAFSKYDFQNTLVPVTVNGNPYKSLEMQSINAFVTLPFYTQVSIGIGIPSYKLYGKEIDLITYSFKLEFDQWLSESLPHMALMYNDSKISIDGLITVNSNSYHLILSKTLYDITAYGSVTLSQNNSNLELINLKTVNKQKEVYTKLGLSAYILFFESYIESNLNQETKNFSAGIVFSF
jgi:hypothetical protein